jgi:iron complex outermembrane receptor protein
VVKSTRATKKTPVSYSEISKEELRKTNLGQDIPILLNFLPNVVSTTFDGTGIGYTDIRIRGAENSRINVTLNGIPYNDADSQGSFWVNLQDFASSVENVQVQRGVGTSTNGAGAFGASINVLTDDNNRFPYAEIASSAGSFNTFKNTVKVGTGLLNDKFMFNARLSRIESDGFIDRAFADLRSYYLSGIYRTDKTQIKALVFGGEERTGLSFTGQTREEIAMDRRANPDGLYFDAQGNRRAYDNETDNYNQDHYQLHVSHKFNENWTGNISGHYTYGRGFFEQYMDDAFLLNFRLLPVTVNGVSQIRSDLVTQGHLNSDFYGAVFSLNFKKDEIDVILGGGVNRYDGEQYGDVINVINVPAPNLTTRYFDNRSDKTDANLYLKTTYDLTENLTAYGDLQIRRISYEAGGTLRGNLPLDVDENFFFFNPKAGLTYQLDDKNRFYLSYARANREPARVDFENGNPEPEELDDFELGWRHDSQNFRLNANAYYMDFRNQLVLTGAIDAVGFPIRENSGSSYRLGLELDAVWRVADQLVLRPNLALSINENRDFFAERDGELRSFGNTEISYSPSVVAGGAFTYEATENLDITLFSKYVGEQFMSNIEAEASKLDAYGVLDLNTQYIWNTMSWARDVTFTFQVNNFFDLEYENNGYFFSFDAPNDAGNLVANDFAFLYAQAGINFLTGVTVRF